MKKKLFLRKTKRNWSVLHKQTVAVSINAANNGQDVKLAPMKIAPPAPKKLTLAGSIVESTDDGLVLLSLGRDDGVRNGMQFLVSADRKLKGTISIIKVLEDKSVGRIESVVEKHKIQKGDTVMHMASRPADEDFTETPKQDESGQDSAEPAP